MAKVNRHKAGGTHRVPSYGGRKSLGVAAWVFPRCDVPEARSGFAIQPWVEEAKRGLAMRKSVVIKKRDNARHDLYISGQPGSRRWTNQTGGRRGSKLLTGVEPLVPHAGISVPLRNTLKFSPCAAMSGNPRPEALHNL